MQEEIAAIQKEIAMLRECNHPNIVKYYVSSGRPRKLCSELRGCGRLGRRCAIGLAGSPCGHSTAASELAWPHDTAMHQHNGCACNPGLRRGRGAPATRCGSAWSTAPAAPSPTSCTPAAGAAARRRRVFSEKRVLRVVAPLLVAAAGSGCSPVLWHCEGLRLCRALHLAQHGRN